MKIRDIASVVRSKNAGPFYVTIDILFKTMPDYVAVRDSGALAVERVAALYHTPPDKIQYFTSDAAQAIKFTLPRQYPSGDYKDCDVYGAQQHAPILDIEVPKK